jgi:hypothetical protein
MGLVILYLLCMLPCFGKNLSNVNIASLFCVSLDITIVSKEESEGVAFEFSKKKGGKEKVQEDAEHPAHTYDMQQPFAWCVVPLLLVIIGYPFRPHKVFSKQKEYI